MTDFLPIAADIVRPLPRDAAREIEDVLIAWFADEVRAAQAKKQDSHHGQ